MKVHKDSRHNTRLHRVWKNRSVQKPPESRARINTHCQPRIGGIIWLDARRFTYFWKWWLSLILLKATLAALFVQNNMTKHELHVDKVPATKIHPIQPILMSEEAEKAEHRTYTYLKKTKNWWSSNKKTVSAISLLSRINTWKDEKTFHHHALQIHF